MTTNQHRRDVPKADYCIEIDYKKGSDSPSRVFLSMSNLIDSFQRADKTLVDIIDVDIQPVLLLEDIETGSIKAWLRAVLTRVPDDSLYNMDWKPIIGQYLVKAKRLVIDWTNNKTTITNASELKPLMLQLHGLAASTDLKLMPSYSPITERELLDLLSDFSISLSPLVDGDIAKYVVPNQAESTFNLDFNLVPEEIEDLITSKTTTMSGELILKIKKPDYLGESMWELKHGKETIQAAIMDKHWLQQFQSGQVAILPGDSIRAIVNQTYKYDEDNNLISERRTIETVTEVIHEPPQSNMFDDRRGA
jgi:hypothetical protein